MSMLLLVMLGAPGSGKGTQALVISKYFGIPSISTGEMVRSEVKNNGPLASKLDGIIKRGELVPDDLITSILEQRLSSSDCAHGAILDGYPRSTGQVHTLDMIMQKKTALIFKVIYFKVDRDEVIRRLSGRFICSKCKAQYHKLYKNTKIDSICDICGSTDFEQRADDTPEAIEHRLEVYEAVTAPLISIYKERDDLIEIDGMQDEASVSRAIITSLSNLF